MTTALHPFWAERLPSEETVPPGDWRPRPRALLPGEHRLDLSALRATPAARAERPRAAVVTLARRV